MRTSIAGSLGPVLAALGLAAVPCLAQGVANPGFEASISGRPPGWNTGGAGYEVAVDTVGPQEGASALRSRWIDTIPWQEGPNRFGVVSQSFPLALALGRSLHLTGYIRAEGITAGYAGFWMRVDGLSGVLAFDNMSTRGLAGTKPWTRFDIELPVDSGATAIVLGMLHPGNGTAWFDSMTVSVVGPAMPRRFVPPVPRPDEDMSRLLTDHELAPAPDSAGAPAVEPEWAAWVRENAQPVRSLGAPDFSDLRFLAPPLRDKRIVQLGESGHGVAEFDMAKVRLIKYLHEELGYDVIAFESSVYECNRAQYDVNRLSALELMRGCIFGVWHTEEALPLFDYIKATQATAHPLILAGFDEQTSTPLASQRPAFFRSLIAPVSPEYADYVYRTDSLFLFTFRGATNEVARAAVDRYVGFYDSLATWIKQREPLLVSQRPDDPMSPAIARQAAISMTVFARQLAQGPGVEGSNIRDLGMANNLDFLLDEAFPGRKIMVWAHNFHIQMRRNVFANPAASTTTPRSMGVWVADRHRAETYTMGLFMYRGSAAQNNRQVYGITRAAPNGLEAILHRAPWRYSFVDFSSAPDTPGTAWMNRRLIAKEWGTNPQMIVPRDEYDGVLFIDTTYPPRYR